MTKIRFLGVAALVLAVGCKKSSDSGASSNAATGDPSTCAGAVSTGMQTMLDSRKAALEQRLGSATNGSDREAKVLERATKMMDTLKGVLTTRCTEDKWSADSIACISKVTRREDVQACIAKLPKDQADRTNADVMKAMTAGMGMRMRPPEGMNPHGSPLGSMPAPGAPGSGDAPAGSAAPGGSAAITAPPPAAPAGSAH